MMRPSKNIIALSAALLLLGTSACVSSKTSGEVTYISDRDSRIEFTDRAAVTLKAAHFKQADESQSIVTYTSRWSYRSLFPNAQAQYYQLSPGYIFTSEASISDYLDTRNFGTAKVSKTVRQPAVIKNATSGQYELFTVGKAKCIALSRSTGGSGERTGRIVGHYCARETRTISAARLLKIAESLAVRERTPGQSNGPSPSAKKGGLQRLAISVHWPTRGGDVKGVTIQKPFPIEGRFWFPMPGSDAECSGEWERPAKFTGYIKPLRGKFDLLCTNGITASGDLAAAVGGPSELHGIDTDGHVVTIKVIGRD